MQLIHRRILIAALVFGLLLLCLYLAWRPSPKLSDLWFIPTEFARWADAQYNLRTAFPFVGLGFLGALVVGDSWCRLRLLAILLFAFSILLEVGQLFIPSRSPNFEDIFFGCAGALIGIGLAAPLLLLRRTPQSKDSPKK